MILERVIDSFDVAATQGRWSCTVSALIRWEALRVVYNLIVMSLALLVVWVRSTVVEVEWMMTIGSVVVYVGLMNIAFTCGELVEGLLRALGMRASGVTTVLFIAATLISIPLIMVLAFLSGIEPP